MSCFIVSTTHVDALLTWARTNPGYSPAMFGDELDQAGRTLLDDNARAYFYRYSHRDDVGTFEPSEYQWRQGKKLDAVGFIKAAQCMRYQMAEFDGWEKSTGAQMLAAWIERAISTLAGYDGAAWSIE